MKKNESKTECEMSQNIKITPYRKLMSGIMWKIASSSHIAQSFFDWHSSLHVTWSFYGFKTEEDLQE